LGCGGVGNLVLRKSIIACASALVLSVPPAAADDVAVARIAVLVQPVNRPPALSNLDAPPDDAGLLGARLAAVDNNTTGRFTMQRFELIEKLVPADGDAVAAFKELIGQGLKLVVAIVGRETLLRLADLPEAGNTLIFNAGAPDDSLRNEECRANILHTLPSRAMLADALAQYLAWKRWSKWLLVVGRRDEDKLFAEAVKRAAKRFGAKIIAEKAWTFGPDARRTAQSEVLLFTQDADYDVLVVADEVGEFGEYLMYRTWAPKVVAGTQGLVPTSWHRAHEQWGAAQLQSRFRKAFQRWMNPTDYHAWAAVRSVGEAATRTRSAKFQDISAYIRGSEFGLPGFKGQALSFRKWNGQLRQPILLAAPNALVWVSPQPGYLHQNSHLDTLGFDEPESKCARR
jgi:ABC transporter substrate binding protein (PQQ-dependent alcohol dehydrogenase system)